jgi:hypothetical protein
MRLCCELALPRGHKMLIDQLRGLRTEPNVKLFSTHASDHARHDNAGTYSEGGKYTNEPNSSTAFRGITRTGFRWRHDTKER